MPRYNPLSTPNLGLNIAIALVSGEPTPLDEVGDIRLDENDGGGGIYALYYLGDSDPYRIYGRLNREVPRFPIYIGQAMAAKTVNGLQEFRRQANRRALLKRISKHANKIDKSSDPDDGGVLPRFPLAVEDFSVRFLHLADAHVHIAESALITIFNPPWNGTGFGSNTPGRGRPGLRESNLWPLFHVDRNEGPELPRDGPDVMNMAYKIRRQQQLMYGRQSEREQWMMDIMQKVMR